MTLARQGKLREAAQVIGAVVSFEDGLLARWQSAAAGDSEEALHAVPAVPIRIRLR